MSDTWGCVFLLGIGFIFPFGAAWLRSSKRHPENAESPGFQWYWAGVHYTLFMFVRLLGACVLRNPRLIAVDEWTLVFAPLVFLGSALGELVRRDYLWWKLRGTPPGVD